MKFRLSALFLLMSILLVIQIIAGMNLAYSKQFANSTAAQSVLNEDRQTFLSSLSDEEIKYLKSTPTIVVCNIAQAAGSEASLDLVKIIADKTGLIIKASRSFAWQEGIDSLQNKTCDVLPWATETESRSSYMNFTVPYTRIMRVLITKQNQPYIANILDFDDKVFATEKDNHLVTQLKNKYPNMLTVRTNHTLDALNLVLEDKIFASIASIYSVANLFTTDEYSNLKIAGQLPREFDDVVSLATRKNDLILHSILNKAVETTNPKLIRDFMNQGAIFNHQQQIDYSTLWLVGGVSLIIFLLLIGWNGRLRTLNNQLEIAQSELEKKSLELERLSVTDVLTQTFNRLKIDTVFAHEIERHERYTQPLSIIMIDIDHFKTVNDRFGHLVGDQVLSIFAKLLSKNLRGSDILGRWGGEEFLAICPSTTEEEAKQIAVKLRIIVEETKFPYVQQVTACFGVAQWQKGDTQEMLTSKADRALYYSKDNGRNTVTVFAES